MKPAAKPWSALFVKCKSFVKFKPGGEREPRFHLAKRSRRISSKGRADISPDLNASRRCRISSLNSASSCSLKSCKLMSRAS
jgi:hypothetical protein